MGTHAEMTVQKGVKRVQKGAKRVKKVAPLGHALGKKVLKGGVDGAV